MKKSFILFFILLIITNIFSYQLTHEMTPEEAKIKNFNKDFYETDPPQGPVRNIAEFDKMEGVLVRYPFGIPIALIADMSQDITVTTIVANQSQQSTVLNTYEANGVNIQNCNFLIAPTDSYWTRDFGPWYIADNQNNIAIVNFPYNRPRPNDNDIPIQMANFLGINLYGMNIVHTGGNYMTDGMGISASSNLVWDENPSLTHEQINQKMHDYLGIDTYHVVQDPNNTYIDHIDCWGKFLAPDKVLIRSVPTTHPQYNEIEETAEYFASQISSYGTPYRVFRVYTPSNQPYTNSLILNNKVYVPIVGSPYDDDAILAYQEAMPGYQIIGVQEDSAHPWESTDALHCRTKGIADRSMLYVKHIPVTGNVETDIDYVITADIIPYSHQNVILDSTLVYYKINNGEFQSIPMTLLENYTYSATIPQQPEGTEIAYYIHSVDEAGNSANHPFIGAADAHHFHVGIPVPPNMEVNPAQFNETLSSNQTLERTLTLSNTGEGEINYTIQVVGVDFSQNKSIEGSVVTMDITSITPGETYNVTVSVTNNSNDEEWLTDVTLQFPQGVTVNSSTDLEGGSSPLITNSATGDAAIIHWADENGGYGNIHNQETASATVNFTVSSDFVADMILNYSITGDQWGDEPHYIENTITLINSGEPITWLSLSQSSGTLHEYDSNELIVTFDSSGLEAGIYNCEIVINDDRDETVIPVMLTVEESASSDNTLQAIKSYPYPNPFVINDSSKNMLTIVFNGSVGLKNKFVKIYNLKGQLVNEIMIENGKAVWNLKNSLHKTVAPGIYLYKLSDGRIKNTGKMIILK